MNTENLRLWVLSVGARLARDGVLGIAIAGKPCSHTRIGVRPCSIPGSASALFLKVSSGFQPTPLPRPQPSRAIASPQPGDGDAFGLRALEKIADGHPLFYIATTIVSRLLHHVTTRAILLGGVGADDVGEGPQRHPLEPDPAEQRHNKHRHQREQRSDRKSTRLNYSHQ